MPRAKPKVAKVRMKRLKVVTYKMVPAATTWCEPPYVAFGEAVRDARHELGWNQFDLAEKVNLSRGSIANIETGRQRILLGDIFLFAKVLRLDPKKLFAACAAVA